MLSLRIRRILSNSSAYNRARNKVYTENACTEGYYEEVDRFGRFLDCNRYAFYADYPQSSGWSDYHRSVVVCRL